MARSAPQVSSLRASPASEILGWSQSLSEILVEHRPLFVVLLGYLVYALAIDAALPGHRVVQLRLIDDLFVLMLEIYTAVFIAGYLPWAVRHAREGEPLATSVLRRFRATFLTSDRLLRFALAILYARVLTDLFTSLKATIPLLRPFSWDHTFFRWDQALHLGIDPWRWLAPVTTPVVVAAVNFFYNLWIFLLFGIFIWQAWSTNLGLRKRFFLTFGLSWILLGTLSATVLSSAGPCYYGRVVAGETDHYRPLMTKLHEVNEQYPVWALDVQETLWASYQQQQRQVDFTSASQATSSSGQAATPRDDTTVKKMLSGISAMPSMHVAMAVLFALLGWQVHRVAGIALTLFAVVIQIGSVMLGWHYALDGYVSAVAVALLWFIVGRLLGSRHAPFAARPLPAPRLR